MLSIDGVGTPISSPSSCLTVSIVSSLSCFLRSRSCNIEILNEPRVRVISSICWHLVTFGRSRDGSSRSARRDSSDYWLNICWTCWSGGASESCRSRRANLLRYQACPAALGTAAFLPLLRCQIAIRLAAPAPLQFGDRSPLTILERRVETLHPLQDSIQGVAK